jgi:hypothetical protein
LLSGALGLVENRWKEVQSQVLQKAFLGCCRSTEKGMVLMGIEEGFLEEVMWHLMQ